MANALYYGDNLDVLRKEIRDESVDLIYLDPPSGRGSQAQIEAFEDTWHWGPEGDRPTAAFTAFSRAQQLSPESWEPYYALAKNRFDQASKLSPEAKERLSLFGDTIANCDRVIDLSLAPAFTRVSPPSPIDLALSYNLKGLAKRHTDVPSGAGGAPPAEPRVVPGFLAPDHCLVPAELGSPPRLSLVRGAVQKPQRTKASPPSGVDVPPQRQDAAASAACQMERAALLREPTSTPPAP